MNFGLCRATKILSSKKVPGEIIADSFEILAILMGIIIK